MVPQIGNEMRLGQFRGQFEPSVFRPLPIDELEEIETDSNGLDPDEIDYVLNVIDIAIEGRLLFLGTDEHGIYTNHATSLPNHSDLLVADVALDVVIAARICV